MEIELFMAKRNGSSNWTGNTFSNLEERFAQFEGATGSVLTQSDLGHDEAPELTEGELPNPKDPRVAALTRDGFHVVNSL